MKVAILDDYQDAARKLAAFAKMKDHDVTAFTDHCREPAALAARLKDFEVVLLIQQRCPFPRAVIEQLPKLRHISQTGRNVAHVDVAACTERGIVVSAGGAANPHAPAELTWGLILDSMRHLPLETANLKAGRWQSTVGVGLKGRTLGIYAYGKIGSIVARVGRAFGMHVVCWGREGSTTKARAEGYDIAASREAFFSGCDVISLHIPLNKETRGIVTAADLALMKPAARRVNTSRAGLVGDAVLAAALKQGRPGFAAVDVFDDEPVLGARNPLIGLPNVVAAPHLGYVEIDTYELYFGAAFDQINGFAAGKPINVANPEAVGK